MSKFAKRICQANRDTNNKKQVIEPPKEDAYEDVLSDVRKQIESNKQKKVIGFQLSTTNPITKGRVLKTIMNEFKNIDGVNFYVINKTLYFQSSVSSVTRSYKEVVLYTVINISENPFYPVDICHTKFIIDFNNTLYGKTTLVESFVDDIYK